MKTMLAMAMVTIAAVSYAEDIQILINDQIAIANLEYKEMACSKMLATTAKQMAIMRMCDPSGGDTFFGDGQALEDEAIALFRAGGMAITRADFNGALTAYVYAGKRLYSANEKYQAAERAYNTAPAKSP